jgi:hypothetical protein
MKFIKENWKIMTYFKKSNTQKPIIPIKVLQKIISKITNIKIFSPNSQLNNKKDYIM